DNGKPDSFKKKYHSYAQLINKDIHSELKKMILSEEIRSLEIFNMEVLKQTLYWLNTLPEDKNIYYGEKLIWIAALHKMIERYGLNAESYQSTLTDKVKPYFYTPLEINAKMLKQILFNV